MRTTRLLSLVSLTAACLFAAEPFTPGTREAFARARTERVAIVGVGDSNQQFGGFGWSRGMAEALTRAYGCWGSGVVWMRSTADDLAAHGPNPSDFAGTFAGWYLPGGATDRVGWKHGQLHLAADGALDITGPLRFRLRYGTFAAGDGSFRPSIRVDQPPWTILVNHEPVRPATGAAGMSEVTVELPADPERRTNLMFSVSPVREDITGPFYGSCMQAENTACTAGVSYTTLYARGGQSLFDMLTTFRKELGPERCADYFRQIRAPLNGGKRCIVMISSGLNDRNEGSPSAGPRGGLASHTPEGFRDNLAGIVQVLQADWVAAGGAPDTIFFAFMPSHPVSDPDDPKLVAYRQQAVALAGELPNAGCILWPELVTYDAMKTGKYYDKGAASSPHLSREGYRALSAAAANALSQP